MNEVELDRELKRNFFNECDIASQVVPEGGRPESIVIRVEDGQDRSRFMRIHAVRLNGVVFITWIDEGLGLDEYLDYLSEHREKIKKLNDINEADRFYSDDIDGGGPGFV